MNKYITDVVAIEPLGEVEGLQRLCVDPEKVVAGGWGGGVGGGCGQWAGGDKRVLFFVMGNRKRGTGEGGERDSERLYLGGNHFGVAA